MKLFTNIGALVGARRNAPERLHGAEMLDAAIFKDAWMAVDSEHIADFGSMHKMPEYAASCELIDVARSWVFPSFCDSHTHTVYAGERAGEFEDKIAGLSYEDIARRGGGILNSADLLHDTSEDSLYEQAMQRVNEMIAKGTGAIEIKSGYGLNTADELKMLRVIDRIKRTTPAIVRSTFLGAHAVGRAWKNDTDAYVNMMLTEMIPAVGQSGLADYIDVFCDRGYFTPEHTAAILEAGARWGMKPKIHANELDVSGGVQVGTDHNAISVDHLERCTDAELQALQDSPATMPTVLPGASFFLNMPYGRAKDMIERNLAVALASDYNPGSSPSGDMRFVCSLACIKMRLQPSQALNAATLNGAAAMELSHIAGSITPGKIANFFITTPLPSLAYLFYAYTTPLITATYLRGCRQIFQ